MKAENYKSLLWQFSKNGEEWSELTGNLGLGKTPKISRRAFVTDTGYYRVQFLLPDNSNGYSDKAYLSVSI